MGFRSCSSRWNPIRSEISRSAVIVWVAYYCPATYYRPVVQAGATTRAHSWRGCEHTLLRSCITYQPQLTIAVQPGPAP